MLYILIAILMFGILIAVHEFGHFFTAKLLGVRVNEFSIGMGPKLLSHQKGETLYTLRALPVGGFCAMEGEDDDSDDPNSFSNKAGWKKLIILVAGSFMNFVAGLLILLIIFSQATAYHVPVVESFRAGSGLEATGLLPGDRFLKIDGHPIYLYGDASLYLGRAGDVVDLEVERAGQRVVLNDVSMGRKTFVVDGQEQRLRGINITALAQPASFFTRIQMACYQAVDYVRMVWMSLGDLVTGAVGVKDLSGPIGIVSMISDVGQDAPDAASAVSGILTFVAFIAVNLAVMNLLPIPALDGGRIFFLMVNGVFTFFTRKKLDPKYEGYVNVAGFFCLILLMVFVAVNDVVRLIQ